MNTQRAPPIRFAGQRTLDSSLLFRSQKLSENSKQDADICGGSSLSLSDFLDKKLHGSESLVVPRLMKGKSNPFLSSVERKDDSTGRQMGIRKEIGGNKIFPLDKSVLQVFKHQGTENGNAHDIADVQRLSKRKNPFEGEAEKRSNLKGVIVLGDDQQLSPKNKEQFTKKKKQRYSSNQIRKRTHYNHYANGGGWWDCDMEGVDNEEVGLNEVWEGVGSTTLGSMEWH